MLKKACGELSPTLVLFAVISEHIWHSHPKAPVSTGTACTKTLKMCWSDFLSLMALANILFEQFLHSHLVWWWKGIWRISGGFVQQPSEWLLGMRNNLALMVPASHIHLLYTLYGYSSYILLYSQINISRDQWIFLEKDLAKTLCQNKAATYKPV